MTGPLPELTLGLTPMPVVAAIMPNWAIGLLIAVIIACIGGYLLMRRAKDLQTTGIKVIVFGTWFWLIIFLQVILYAIYRTWLMG